MDIKYKISRIIRWQKKIGMLSAASFEIQQTIRKPLIKIFHPGIDRWIYLRGNSSDVSVFESVFIEDEFDMDLDKADIIVDCGANCGLTAAYLAWRHPGSKVIAIEPSSANCEMILKNTAGLDVEIRRSAVWSKSTFLKIENSDAEPWAFRCVEASPKDHDAFMATDLSEIIDNRSCALVKLDIEGAETEVFKKIDWLSSVAKIVVEAHSAVAEEMIRRACDGWRVSRAGEKLVLERV